MEARFGMQAGGLRGKDKRETPADGPARVVKPGDWGAVAESGMKGFQMAAISVPGRTPPKPSEADLRAAESARETRKAEEAHKQALAKAVADGEAAARAAMARGREEGLREGEAKAREHYDRILGEVRGNAALALDSLAREKASLFLEFEGNVLELVSASIHRVFGGMSRLHADAVLPLVGKAVAALGQASAILLKVNPEDLASVDANRPFWLPVEASLKDIRIVADERIPKGGCFVESDSTSVSMDTEALADRIDEELKRIFSAKAQALKNAESRTAEADAGFEAGDALP